MSLLTGWRLPLRMARRDALRHRGRSALVVVMIALPVLGVTAADVLIQTTDVSGDESIDRRMGSAAALVTVQQGNGHVLQQPDPEDGVSSVGADGSEPLPSAGMPSAEEVSNELGGARLLEIRTGGSEVPTDKGQAIVMVTEVDLGDPMTQGLFDLTSGRVPRTADEVVVNQALLDKGYAVGQTLEASAEGEATGGELERTIVGVAESTTYRDAPVAMGPLGAFEVDTDSTRSWLVDGGSVSWDTVLELNAIGAVVASRAVITDPPPSSEVQAPAYASDVDEAVVAVILLIVVMALIEVVLLAGPAFAVGARKQQRSLALMAAAGGTPAQSRRVIVSSAIVVGGVAAAVGVGLGIGVARLLVPVAQRWSGTWLGPFDVPWLHVLGVAGFGLLSAFLAAVVPAYIASRQDVVAVLAGRRGDRAPSFRSPLIGLVLLGVGLAGSIAGRRQGGEVLIAASAIPAVLGMMLLIPVVLAGLAHASGGLPLALRYAVRDAARHRTRTVPAVAAVAATVAGVVALGIGVTSDAKENEETYVATMTSGTAAITGSSESEWESIAAVVEREVPAADQSLVRGVDENGTSGDASYFVELLSTKREPVLQSWSSSIGSSIPVSDQGLPPGIAGVSEKARAEAAQALAAGKVVAFTDYRPEDAEVELTARVSAYDPDTGEQEQSRELTVPALLVQSTSALPGVQAVVPTAVADDLGVPVATVGLVVHGAEITEQQEDGVREGLAAVSDSASWYVERGYQADEGTVIVQLVLLGLGAVLMLGGTLTATFLALSDARPDLATLAAVGAPPRTRRGVAAAYAAVVGLVGALLGAAVGFIPGIAVTYPLTTTSYVPGGQGPFLDVPWLLVLTLVLALPLLTALIVGLFARSRLPLVARLD